MPFNIVRNDLTNMHADAIVNTANPQPTIGSGADSEVHRKAGRNLLRARKKIGDIPYGDAVITPAFDLNAKYVIHTPGPVWHGGSRGEAELLRSCYRSCLALAAENGCKTVDFPSISTGVYHFPLEKASVIAIDTIAAFLAEHKEIERVRMVCFDERTAGFYEKSLADCGVET